MFNIQKNFIKAYSKFTKFLVLRNREHCTYKICTQRIQIPIQCLPTRRHI